MTRVAALAAAAMAAIYAAIAGLQHADPVDRAALSFLVELEGIELREYDDGAGYRTCGVGHVMAPGEVCPKTAEEALLLLASDIRKKSHPALANIGGASLALSTLPLLLSPSISVAVASMGQPRSNCLMQGSSSASPTLWRVGTRLERDEGGRWSSGPVWSIADSKNGKCLKENANGMAEKTAR